MAWTSLITPIIIGLLVGILVDRIDAGRRGSVRGRALWIPLVIVIILLVLFGIGLEKTKVTFETSPSDTAVYVDGREQGKEVSPILWGSHTMWIEKEGYKSIKDKAFWVLPLRKNEQEETLQPKFGRIVIDVDASRRSVPIYVSIWNAEKVVDEFSTKKRNSCRVPFGTYSVAIKKTKDGIPLFLEIQVYADRDHDVYVSL